MPCARAAEPAEVLAISLEHIEGAEERRGALKHQMVKGRTAVRLETDDLAVDDCPLAAQRFDERTIQRRPRREHVSVPTHELAPIAVDDRHATNPSHFSSKIQSGSSKGSASFTSGIGAGIHPPIISID